MPNLLSRIVGRIQTWRSAGRVATRDRVGRLFRFKYACFKDLLASNTELLNIITDFEEKLHGREVFGMSYVRSQATRAVFHTLKMVIMIDDMSGHCYATLFQVVEQLNRAIKDELGRRKELPVTDLVLPYSKITKEMVDWVGGKNANLGELLNRAGLPIPRGFAVTTRAYELFLEHNDLIEEISRVRRGLDPNDPRSVNTVGEEIQKLITAGDVPPGLNDAILEAYGRMVEEIREAGAKGDIRPNVALRSSAIGEDSELSYAGQYLSVLNVPRDSIIEKYKLVLASLYTPRAVSYRLNKGLRDEDIAMSVACIEMVESVASGVIYSRDPASLLDNNVVVTGVWGLGPYAVEGVITPDCFVVAKDSELTILESSISCKDVQLIAEAGGGLSEVQVESDRQARPCLSDDQVRTLAGYAVDLERHYQYPQDIEWALDRHGRLLVLQTRPLHLEEPDEARPRALPIVQGYPLLVEGGSVASSGIGCGPAFHVRSDQDLADFPEGAVLVAKHSDPQYVVVMRKAQAIVTDAGSVTGHMASIAREFGVPTLLGAKAASSLIPQGAEITVDAYSAKVYQGRVPELLALQRTKESVMKDTPVYETLRRVADYIIPLNLVDPGAANFNPEHCRTLHDIMRLVHELSYREMFHISDTLSGTQGAGALKLLTPVPLDLYVIDLGRGLAGVTEFAKSITVENVVSIPLEAVLKGMLHEGLTWDGPRPIDVGGFLSVVREQMLAPNSIAERFGNRSYAIVSKHYLNFSSRIGYHYSVLDAYCSDIVTRNYITFAFKGGAADETRRNRRVRAIGTILEELGFSVKVRGDRLDARYHKYTMEETWEKLDMVGRLLQFTRQMDMLMHSEASVQTIARGFLDGNYRLDDAFFRRMSEGETDGQSEDRVQ